MNRKIHLHQKLITDKNMRIHPYIILFLIFSVWSATAQYTQIPDPIFEANLAFYDDTPNDGQILTENIADIESLDVADEGISDLTGIEDFTALIELNCYENSLSSLDVSALDDLEVLRCYDNNLTSLTVSGLGNLVELECDNNNLTSLNLTGVDYLEILKCEDNQLTSLNTEDLENLEELYCANNSITSLDLQYNTYLDIVDAQNNSISSFNCENLEFLTELYLNDNSLTQLDISELKDVERLYLSNNSLTVIDVTLNSELTYFEIANNIELGSLDLSENLELFDLDISDNELLYVNLKNGQNSSINSFDASNNRLLNCILVDDASYATTNWTSIDAVTSFNDTACDLYTTIPDANFEAALETLGYDDISGDGQVPTLNIYRIEHLDIEDEGISDLTGLEDFRDLIYINCKDNSITSVDLTNNLKLEAFKGDENQFTTVDFSKNSLLNFIDLDTNLITSLDVSANTLLEYMDLEDNKLSSIDLSQNTLIEVIDFETNELTSLDLSNNKLIQSIDVQENLLTSLTLPTGTTSIEEIVVNDNQLTSLDVSEYTNLEYLELGDNQVETLDLSANPALERFIANSNNLTAINFKNGANTSISLFVTENNTNLTCIEVDDSSYSTSNWTYIDDHTSFSENCNYEILVTPTIILEGAFSLDTGNIIMQDDLRTNAYLPISSPYNASETCEATVFDTTGENAVVDWIEIQLRDANDISQIVSSTSAFILRNGTIVATDGTSSVAFPESQGDYYIAIAHRNHLTIASNTTYSLSGTVVTTIDFTDTSSIYGGTSTLTSLGDGYYGMPLGDIDENGQVQNADVSATIIQIGISGYNVYDADMNGQVQNADVNIILQNLGKGEQF